MPDRRQTYRKPISNRSRVPQQRFERVTELENPASEELDRKSVSQILRLINHEDQKVPRAVGKTIPQIARAVEWAANSISKGGRLIYLGAGTSGRLGVLDGAECGPTFNTGRVVAVLAGGPRAMFAPVEKAEDKAAFARRDLRRIRLSRKDVVVGISASGSTPYTLAGVRYAREVGARTVAVTCNPQAPLDRLAELSVVPVVGPEVIAGSTRLKAGTAQKLVLNMLSTATMVRLGRVLSGMMINVQLKNAKLKQRATKMLMRLTGARSAAAARALEDSGKRLPVALLMLAQNLSARKAASLLKDATSPAALLRRALDGKNLAATARGKRTKRAKARRV